MESVGFSKCILEISFEPARQNQNDLRQSCENRESHAEKACLTRKDKRDLRGKATLINQGKSIEGYR